MTERDSVKCKETKRIEWAQAHGGFAPTDCSIRVTGPTEQGAAEHMGERRGWAER